MNDADIERLARAACEAMGVDPDGFVEILDRDGDLSGLDSRWRHYIPAVRAILAALWRPVDEADSIGPYLISGGFYSCEELPFEVSSAKFNDVAIAQKEPDGSFVDNTNGNLAYWPTHYAPLIPPPEQS
jgi:hypothetical protein